MQIDDLKKVELLLDLMDEAVVQHEDGDDEDGFVVVHFPKNLWKEYCESIDY